MQSINKYQYIVTLQLISSTCEMDHSLITFYPVQFYFTFDRDQVIDSIKNIKSTEAVKVSNLNIM